MTSPKPENPISKSETPIKAEKSARKKRDSKKNNTSVGQRANEAKKITECIDQSTTVKFEANTLTDVPDSDDLIPLRHSRLSQQECSKHFVSKDGKVYRTAKGGQLRLKKLQGRTSSPSYIFVVEGRNITIKREEIIAASFQHPFDPVQHYIFYKDGDRENICPSNMIVCRGLDKLRELEIERLKTEEPDARYISINNIDDKLTFSHYLVSDTGKVHSLFFQRQLTEHSRRDGFWMVTLASDIKSKGVVRKAKSLYIHAIVKQSFDGCRMNTRHIFHLNGNRNDNSLQNLEFLTPDECARRTHSAANKATRKALKAQGKFPKNYDKEPSLPPVAPETKWLPVNTLQWNGQKYSRYEVSNMGHVRRADTQTLLTYYCSYDGCLYVRMTPDLNTEKTQQVARLVANAFVDGYDSIRNEVRHINNNNHDNRAENLEWVESTSSLKNRRCRRVVAYLDNETVTKEFPSCKKAEIELGCYLRHKFLKGAIVTRIVTWEGKKQEAKIKIF